ncbi:MAG: hypothetical protein J6J53_01895 [Muribaculaceae bacterium]|nr:hypothetical protein [Muribaculaceae bacterium]
MWLFNSSIGKKFIMALTGICLVLFVTFHVLMNAVAIFWPGAYNQVCLFLGANWYALIASMGLGLLVVIHIIDAIVLTLQNRKARGNDRYAVSARPKSVEWSSQNMLVLGFVVLVFLGVHLVQFWARMQAQEVMGTLYTVNGVEVPPAAGTLFLQLAFQNWWTPVIYIIGFIALWFHMNHGFWSMWQSIGWDNNNWLPRWKAISCWWVTIVCGLFTLQAVVFTIRANQNYYVENPALMAQYQEMIAEHMEKVNQPIIEEMQSIQRQHQQMQSDNSLNFMEKMQKQGELEGRFNELRAMLDQNQAKAYENFIKIADIAKKCEPAAVCTEAAPVDDTAADAAEDEEEPIEVAEPAAEDTINE